MDLSQFNFGEIIKHVFSNAMVRFALALLGADVLTGIGISLYQKTFKLGATADFLYSRALPYFLGAFALQLVIMALPPDWPVGGIDSNLGTVVWGFVVAALVGHFLDNLRQMGLPIPEIMTDKKVPETKTTLSILLPLALGGGLVLSASACVKPNPNISPERNVALYGIQVSGYLKEAKTTADDLFAKQVLPEAPYKRVLETLRTVNEAGVKLAEALATYDAATSPTDKENAVKQVNAALATLNVLLPTILPEVTNADGRAKVVRIITDVQRLVITITQFTSPKVGRFGPQYRTYPALAN